MNVERWTEVLSRIGVQEPVNVDALTARFDGRVREKGSVPFVLGGEYPKEMPYKSEEMGAIGFRLTQPRDDLVQVALNLASLALENEVEVVVLNHLEYCGLESFGFRCERITGATQEDRAACEEEVCRLWNIDMVL